MQDPEGLLGGPLDKRKVGVMGHSTLRFRAWGVEGLGGLGV